MAESRTFTFYGRTWDHINTSDSDDRFVQRWFLNALGTRLSENGHQFQEAVTPAPNNVIHILDLGDNIEDDRAFKRKSKKTFVVGIAFGVEGQLPDDQEQILSVLYRRLIRIAANAVMAIIIPGQNIDFNAVPPQGNWKAYTVAPESPGLGVHEISSDDFQSFMDQIYERLAPILNSTLAIDYSYRPSLPIHLFRGNDRTLRLAWLAHQISDLDLLPAPYKARDLEQIAQKSDLRRIERLFGVGALSYGYFAVREPGIGHWTSISGIDKSSMTGIPERDVTLIAGYDQSNGTVIACSSIFFWIGQQIRVRFPSWIAQALGIGMPRRPSVESYEQWLIFKEFPDVNVIVHFHGWWRNESEMAITQSHYPCATKEAALEVVRALGQVADPTAGAIGIPWHGIVVTDSSVVRIIKRIQDCYLKYTPLRQTT